MNEVTLLWTTLLAFTLAVTLGKFIQIKLIGGLVVRVVDSQVRDPSSIPLGEIDLCSASKDYRVLIGCQLELINLFKRIF